MNAGSIPATRTIRLMHKLRRVPYQGAFFILLGTINGGNLS
jgi:hypothetical protein